MAWEEKYWEWADQRSSNDEIRVACGGVRFAAPVLIVHYIEEHIVPNAASPYFLPYALIVVNSRQGMAARGCGSHRARKPRDRRAVPQLHPKTISDP